MIKNFLILASLTFITIATSEAAEIIKIKRSEVVSKAVNVIEEAPDFQQIEATQLFEELDEVLEDIIDEVEFETAEYSRNYLKSKIELELGSEDIAVMGGISSIPNAWGSGGSTFTTTKTILASESDLFKPVIKFTIKQYDAYIKNGYSQLDALAEIRIACKSAIEKHQKKKQEETLKEEKEKKKKERRSNRRRNVPSRWRSYQ